jgi:hypothetical protein
MTKHTVLQLGILFRAALIMVFGLFLFKFIPMNLWGENILFDASAHITITSFILYVIWFFIDQNQKWHIPFFVFAFLVLAVISLQRISNNAHNDIGLLGGLIISVSAILYSQFSKFKKNLKF